MTDTRNVDLSVMSIVSPKIDKRTLHSHVFRIKLSKSEVQEVMIRYLKLETLINSDEEQFFTEMSQRGRSFLFEFVVPRKEGVDKQ